MIKVLALFLCFLSVSSNANDGLSGQPSFDCKKSKLAIEKLICSDAGLAKLDRDLSNRYQHLISSEDQATVQFLKNDQKFWLKYRNVSFDECAGFYGKQSESSAKKALFDCAQDLIKSRLSHLEVKTVGKYKYIVNSVGSHPFIISSNSKEFQKYNSSAERTSMEGEGATGCDSRIDLITDKVVVTSGSCAAPLGASASGAASWKHLTSLPEGKLLKVGDLVKIGSSKFKDLFTKYCPQELCEEIDCGHLSESLKSTYASISLPGELEFSINDKSCSIPKADLTSSLEPLGVEIFGSL
jgi:uncharacterized protein YecT (DUF1311 family)